MRLPLAALTAFGIAVNAAAPARAQIVPRLPVAPVAAAAALGGITVPARATVRRPADLVRFAITVGNRTTPGGGLAGASALVSALQRAGIADASLANPLQATISAQQFLTVTGSLRKPTLPDVTALIAKVSSSVPDTVVVQNVNLALYLDDCASVEQAAIVAAHADALARATRYAEAAHVQLGRVLAITAQAPGSPPCLTKPDTSFTAFGGPPDLGIASTSLDVTVSVSETVTFAIR